MNNEEKPLPHSEEIESVVLGKVMVDSENLEELSQIREEHFYLRKNRLIWKVVSGMMIRSESIDLVSITTRVKDVGLMDEIGGVSYISSLATSKNHLSYSKNHFKILEEKRRLRGIIEMSSKVEDIAYNDHSSSEILDGLQNDIFNMQEVSTSGNIRDQSCDSVLDIIERKIKGEVITGIKTGITPWDINLGGLSPRFYVLAARAGRGKTAMAEQIIAKLLMEGKPVLIFEKDMSPEMFIMRMACRMANVSFSKYDLGYCKTSEYEEIKKYIEFIKNSPFHLYSPSNLNPDGVVSIIKREKHKNGIQCVFLDHVLNLDVGSDFRIGLTIASKKIRDSVESCKIPHVILAQLNRGAHNLERPTPANIKEFDALYADCDVMIMLWNHKDFNETPPGHAREMKFLVNKNRFGQEFEEDIGFDGSNMKFVTFK